MFLGISVPSSAQVIIEEALRNYEEHVEHVVPVENWHLTLVWLGSDPQPHDFLAKLTKPIPQSFALTVHMTHVGRGKKPYQLWAYCTASLALYNIRTALLDRLQTIEFPLARDPHLSFLPHITVAGLKSSWLKRSLADTSAFLTFPVRTIDVFEGTAVPESRRYTIIEQIPLS